MINHELLHRRCGPRSPRAATSRPPARAPARATAAAPRRGTAWRHSCRAGHSSPGSSRPAATSRRECGATEHCQSSLTCLPHSRLGPGPAPRPAAARLRAGDRGSSFRGQRRWRRPASPARNKLRTIKSIYFLRLWFCQFSIQLS